MILEDYSKCKTDLDQMMIHNDKINFENQQSLANLKRCEDELRIFK